MAVPVLTLSIALPVTGTLGAPPDVTRAPDLYTAAQPTVIDLSNVPRLIKGCPALKNSKLLTKAAQGHAADMSAKRYFSHTSRDGRTFAERIRATGWKRPGGENIAAGFPATVAVVSAWMDSPGHRRNILNCKFRYIGVGFAAKGNYWVQNFGY